MHLIYGKKTLKFNKIFVMNLLQLMLIASENNFKIYLIFLLEFTVMDGYVCLCLLTNEGKIEK